jgi:hypothetical protein
MKFLNNLPKNKIFVLIIFLLFFSRFADIYTTYINTPDLKKELNPLLSFLGWKYAIVIQIIICIVLAYCSYYYYIKKIEIKNSHLINKNSNLSTFISVFQFGTDKSLLKNIFIKSPPIKTLLYSLGYIGTNTLISAGLIVSFSTFLLINFNSIKSIYRSFHIPLILVCLIIISFIYFTIKFHIIEFNKYRKANF